MKTESILRFRALRREEDGERSGRRWHWFSIAGSNRQESRVSPLDTSREVESLVFVVDQSNEVFRCMAILHASNTSATPHYNVYEA